MSFLRLDALWAMPLVLLPLLIHLIHRRRHPTVPWAAMMFLTRAAASRRAGAKWRRWVILLVRTLVVAAILLALARPLSSGMFGFAAGRLAASSATLVLLDRSPSMQRKLDSGETRQAAALGRIATTLNTVGANRIGLIDSVSLQPTPLADADALLQPTVLRSADSTADLPKMLQEALIDLKENDRQLADIWICSDRQLVDWRPDSPLWKQIASDAESLGSGIRFHLLEFEDDGQINASVALTRLRWIESNGGRELALSVSVSCEQNQTTVVPVRVTVGGVTSSAEIQVVQGKGELDDFRVQLSPDQVGVSGQVSLPEDVNAADDQWFFAASADQNRPVGLVTQTPSVALEVACEVLGDPVGSAGEARTAASRVLPDGLLESVACLIWQGSLPSGEDAIAVERFLNRGGSAVFFPPRQVDDAMEFQGVRWGQWVRDGPVRATFDEWEFPINAWCSIDGQLLRRATVGNNDLLAGKIRVGEGAAWFCAADAINAESPFVKDGLLLYALLFEAIGSSQLHPSHEQQYTAGQETARWLTREIGTAISVTYEASAGNRSGRIEPGYHSGVLSIQPSDERESSVLAINRNRAESDLETISDTQLEMLLPGVTWNPISVVNEPVTSNRGFVRELWGAVWVMVIAGMLIEAWLTLPSRPRGAA